MIKSDRFAHTLHDVAVEIIETVAPILISDGYVLMGEERGALPRRRHDPICPERSRWLPTHTGFAGSE
jgi:hypothetical protein